MSLADAIQPHLTDPFEKLPDDVRGFVRRAFLPAPFGPGQWSDLMPALRARYAAAYDAAHTVDAVVEQEYWFQLEAEIGTLERELRRYQLMSDGGVPSEAILRDTQLSELTQQIHMLKARGLEPASIIDGPGPGAPLEAPPVPGILPSVAIGRLAIEIAWELEQGTTRPALAKNVMEKLIDYATSGVRGADILIKPDANGVRREVSWRTSKGDTRKYTLDALRMALETWMKSRKLGRLGADREA
jgi:hypothetical protein